MAKDEHQEEELQTQRRANLLQMRYFDVRTLNELPMFKGALTVEEMRKNHAVVLSMEEGKMIIAVTTSTPQQALDHFRQKFADHKVTYVMISESGFNKFMLEYDPPEKVNYQDISIKPGETTASLAEVSKTINNVKPDDVFNYLIRQAYNLQASDIHLEVQKEQIRIRFRVDGVLHEIADITPDKYRQLSSTLAIHANISTSSPEPQTGHMSHKVTDDEGNETAEINMRIETIPTLNGQDAVIRLFTIGQELLDLERLGLNDMQKSMVDEIVAHPTGLVLAVGPTGSGKTTTLYSIITKLNSPERKIITLEDPVEYSLPGVVQIPVDTTSHDDSFAEKLKAVLRLDPDVIMVGEIRDADTAKTALQASLSGHLVLSTFHAADTTAALSRLMEFIGDNPLFTSAIRLLVAQRLVRRLDEETKQQQELEPHIKDRVRAEFESMPEGVERPNVDETTFFKAVKNDQSPFGYAGQIAVIELLKMSPQLENLLNNRANESLNAANIRRIAREEGMVTLTQDALTKAAQGVTSVEEVFRVVG